MMVDGVEVAALVHGLRRNDLLAEAAAVLPLSTRRRRLAFGSAVTTRRKLLRSPLLNTCPACINAT